MRPSAQKIASPAALLALAFSLYSTPAHAYIDPGTGSAIVYVVTGVLVSLYFGLRGLYYALVELVFRLRFKAQTCDLALHSETPRYESTFLPVIRALSARGVDLTYFTMYERDSSFEPLPSGVTHHPIPPGLVGYSYLNHLRAKVLVTTTPQLDVMMFRRSGRVKHYCHIPHALGESRFVRPYAYDFFDSVACCGPLLKRNIRRIEAIRQHPAKQLLETGIPHYDELLARITDARESDGKKTVLIAPSWGVSSLFQVFGTGFVREVARRHRVIVRPHPQMKVSQPALYEEILAIDGVTVDVNSSPIDAMSRADLLVSDISGIMHEFAFICERPVIVIDHDVGVESFEGHLLPNAVTLRRKCAPFIVGLHPSEIDRLCDRIDVALEQGKPRRIAALRKKLVYNFGCAGDATARAIEEILRCH